MNNPLFLTKSRFQIGMECQTKLYYHQNGSKYPNQKLDDPFLKALAQGGFQVGALAQAYFPEGVLVAEESNKAAIEKTWELLHQENCTLFEAAIQTGPFLIRVDILRKRGNHLELIEVKAKSFHPETDSFTSVRGEIASAWRPYLTDVAFQQMVIRQAFPTFTVGSFLMLADKSSKATVNGLNQKFRIVNENGRTRVQSSAPISLPELGERILIEKCVDEEVGRIQQEQFSFGEESYDLSSFANKLAADITNNRKQYIGIGKHCNNCEFQTDNSQMFSGFKECWTNQAGLTLDQLKKPLLFELWRGGLGAKDILTPLFNRRDYFLKDFREEDYAPKTAREFYGFSPKERRDLQIRKIIQNDSNAAYNEEYLREQFASFTYPLHFIDFETTALAIPMYVGRRPYEQIAFQFSHHQVEEDGSISHRSQWLNSEVGAFPNFDFVRALKKALENDNGTIFRYHNHENSILNAICKQLSESNEPDTAELCDFIYSITHKDKHIGERDMVDLYQLVIKGFYHPSMKGSNSIKAVLPAMIESSVFLQKKYKKPVYGTSAFPSLNLKDHVWLSKDDFGKWISPYKTLPPVFEGVSAEELDGFCVEEDAEGLADGGAAMMAYAKMQFTEMSKEERAFYHKALLHYCELDTMAMVMIYEGWKDYLNRL